jgi:squalene-hopene/tetraprenyl-beta-curcumene cyclase
MKNIVCGFLAICFSGIPAVAQTAQWDPSKAASYMDDRIEWWMTWKSAARDHETFCVSCHTSAPYAVGRSALRGALAEKGPTADESKVLENVTKRVRMWNEVAPFYPTTDKSPGKTPESRGTESVLNALILSWNDRPSGKLSADAKLALDNMWGEQIKDGDAKGAFGWLQFHNAPFEGDSQYYGAALASVAVAYAPGDYQSLPAIKANVQALESYLSKERESQKLIDQLVVLWASSRLPGLLTDSQKKDIIAATLAKQQEDGGFSLSSLIGDWKRRDKTPLEPKSDGYATGLATFAMEQAGVKPSDPALKRSLQWLAQNQDAAEGRWPAWSLNKQRELASDAGRFMSDAATAYAVMALEASHDSNSHR